MANDGQAERLLVIPCSGIGKVHGLMSRETAYHVIDKLLPGRAETVCLALLVTGDAEAKRKVQEMPCVTLDGCPKLCAFKNVSLSQGNIAKSIRVHDVMKRHRGEDFGTGTALTQEGWTAVEELAAEVVQVAQETSKD